MVGVPGRSKGCNTCKQRRIACGLQRPRCSQCIKSQRACTGYQRERMFIVSDGMTQDVYRAPRKAIPSSPDTQLSDQLHSTEMVISTKHKRGRPRKSTYVIPTPKVDFGTLIHPHALYRQQLLDAFLSCFMPLPGIGFHREERSWMMSLPDILAPTLALEASALALATAQLGRMNNDEVLTRESLNLYTKGLYQLQQSLWDQELMFKDDTLAACMALVLYELVECPAETRYGYVSHQHGCSRLIELRGPHVHVSGFAQQLFLASRVQGLLQALADVRPTFLSDPNWTTIPWINRPKESWDKIMDILALAPTIFARAATLKDMDPRRRLLAMLGIIDRLWEVDAELQRFYEDLERSTLGPLYWPIMSTTDDDCHDDDDPTSSSGKLFPVAFHFLDLRMANVMMWYWATSTMLWAGMTQLYLALHEIQSTTTPSSTVQHTPPFDPSHLPPLAHRTSFITPIRNICQSVEYCMQPSMLRVGPSSVIAPLNIVVDTLKGYNIPEYEREIEWVNRALEKVKERGWRFLGYT